MTTIGRRGVLAATAGLTAAAALTTPANAKGKGADKPKHRAPKGTLRFGADGKFTVLQNYVQTACWIVSRRSA